MFRETWVQGRAVYFNPEQPNCTCEADSFHTDSEVSKRMSVNYIQVGYVKWLNTSKLQRIVSSIYDSRAVPSEREL